MVFLKSSYPLSYVSFLYSETLSRIFKEIFGIFCICDLWPFKMAILTLNNRFSAWVRIWYLSPYFIDYTYQVTCFYSKVHNSPEYEPFPLPLQQLHQDSWYIRIWNVSIPYKQVLLVRVHFKVAEMLQKSYYICNFNFFLIRVLWIWLFDFLHATGFPHTWKTWKKSGILKYFSRVGKTLEFGQNH